MIVYFPEPYNNELYYSILARYHYYSGDILASYTLKELTGRTRNINFEVPMGIDNLVTKAKVFSSTYSRDFFINNHTIIPIVRPFKKIEWTRKLKEENFEGLRFDFFGYKENDIKSKEHLYYCPECLKEQFEKYGEGYWNRIHQVPGIFVCTNHRIALIKHPVNIHNIQGVEFALPRFEDTKREQRKYKSDVLESLLNLSEDIEYLLEKNFDVFPENYFYEKYVTLLEIKGIAYPMLKREQRLKILMLDHFPHEFLEMLNSSFSPSTSWLPKFKGKSRVTTLHPIRHLLLMRLLCGSAREFFENEYEYKPFGTGPWICMNPFADHYLEKVVKKVDVSIHNGNGDIQGDMKCSCGFVYRIRVWEKSPLDIEYFSNRIMEKGPIWEQKFNDLIKQRLTINEIAHRTNMSRPTIRKILRDREKFNDRDLKQLEKYKKIDEKTEKYKEIWLDLRAKYPEYYRHELHSANRAVYVWLRKYDKEWLEANSPEIKKEYKVKKKVYSLEADYVFLDKAQKIISTWSDIEKNQSKLVRKSKSRIQNLLGLGSDYQYTRKRYPLTADYIDLIEESKEEFRKRKVRSVMEEKFKNEEVSFSKVAEAAHLRTFIRKGGEEIKLYIEQLINEHNLNY
ncbi:TnsD family Tn7-like transposition protein [Lysinibacillus sp. NPDC056959]|uniref:TnsD family Tn7-like transposition protein n=1 Tax=Lysinibacillus sp. NPDC056959 TaxID=3345981 RepID=UPI0036259894